MKKYSLKTISGFLIVLILMPIYQLDAQTDVLNAKPLPGDVLYPNWADHDGIASGTISITKGMSQVLRFQRSISRAAISDDEICDVQPLGKQELLIYAKKTGSVNLIVWDDQFNAASYKVESVLNTEKLLSALHHIDPKAEIEITPVQQTIAVYGFATTLGEVEQIEKAVHSFDKRAVVYVKVKEPKQILLEVRFAEVNRKANQDFGLDFEVMSRYHLEDSLTGQTGVAERTTKGQGITLKQAPVEWLPLLFPKSPESATFRGMTVTKDFAAEHFLKLLEQKNILKIIARPNLVARDGESASFLVGGEFPVPVATQNQLTIDWKQFGTNLIFKPEVLENEVIRLKVQSSVSELDFSNTVTISGTTIPTVLTRKHETVAELKDNQTFIIGGLLSQRINRIKKGTPFFDKIPFIGSAFKKEEFSRTDVELLVMITPHIVHPMELGEKKTFYDNAPALKTEQPFHPAFPDAQGDTIQKLIVQEEELQYFDEDARRKAEEQAEELHKKEAKKAQQQPKEGSQIETTQKKVESPAKAVVATPQPVASTNVKAEKAEKIAESS